MSNLIELKEAVSHFREIVFEEVNPQWQSSTWEMCREFWPCDIMLSAGSGESKCVEQALTVEGLNARDNWLETAAMKASRYGHKECLYHIVSAGADLTLQNSDGENVFDPSLSAANPFLQVMDRR